jgi:hypothetical protein
MKRFIILSIFLAVALFLFQPVSAFSAPPDPVDKCKSQKLNAASIYAKKVFYCWARAVKSYDAADVNSFLESNPAADCIDEAATEFLNRWTNAEDGATEESADCTTDATTESIDLDVDALVKQLIEKIAGAVVSTEEGGGPLDMSNEVVQKLTSEVLKAGGRYVFGLLKAESQNLKKQNDNKLERKEVRAMSKLTRKFNNAVEKAYRKGAECTLSVPDIADDVDLLVDECVVGMDPP